jgi:hypothetical protein
MLVLESLWPSEPLNISLCRPQFQRINEFANALDFCTNINRGFWEAAGLALGSAMKCQFQPKSVMRGESGVHT